MAAKPRISITFEVAPGAESPDVVVKAVGMTDENRDDLIARAGFVMACIQLGRAGVDVHEAICHIGDASLREALLDRTAYVRELLVSTMNESQPVVSADRVFGGDHD